MFVMVIDKDKLEFVRYFRCGRFFASGGILFAISGKKLPKNAA